MNIINKTEFGNNFINKMKEVGYEDCSDPDGKTRMLFEGFFAENLNNEEYKEFCLKYNIGFEKYCAALAQLHTIKKIGACNDGPYDIKLFWGMTDEEIDKFIEEGPLELVLRAFATNMEQKKKIIERRNRELGGI